MRLRSVWRAIAGMAMAQGISAALSLLVVVVTARVLGPDGRGTFVAATTAAALMATLFGLSLGSALAHRMQTASVRVSDAVLVATFTRSALVLGVLGASGFAFLTQLGWFGTESALQKMSFLVAALLVPLLLWEQYAVALHARFGLIGRLSRVILVSRCLGALLVCLALFLMSTSVTGALLAVVLGQGVLVALTGSNLRRHAGLAEGSWTELLEMLPAALKLHMTNVSVVLIDAVTVLLVFRSLSATEAGIYQLAQQAVTLLLLVPTAAGIVLHGRMSVENADRDWPTQRRIAIAVFLAVCVATTALSWAAPYVIQLLGGAAFEPSGDLLRMLAWASLGPTLAAVLAPQWIGRGVFALNALVTITAALLLLHFTEVGISRDGVNGAALARVIVLGGVATVVQLAFMGWVEYRYRLGLEASTMRS